MFIYTNLKQLLLSIFLWLSFFGSSSAQKHYFKHYQVEQGLSHNTVYCIAQDNRGFMWFGTKDGLNRFDGYAYKTFRHDPRDKKSLSNNIVHALSTDAEGNLWVGTDNGLDKFDFKTEGFEHIYYDSRKSVRKIVQDTHNNCWFVTGEALIRFNKGTGVSTNFLTRKQFEATSIAVNHDVIWVATSRGTLEKLNVSNGAFKSYNLFDHSPAVASNFTEKIYAAGYDKLLVGTANQGVKEFDCLNGSYTDILTYNADHTEIYVRDFLKSSESEYWIATESGVFIYDALSHKFTNLKKNYNDHYSLSDNAVYSLCRDKEGGMWAGTYFGGVNYYPKQYSTFNKYYPGADNNSLKGNVVREICKDKFGNFWLGTEDNGLNKLSADKNTWTHYFPGAANGLSNSNIHGLLANGNNLLVGTFERGLNIFDIPTGKVKQIFVAGNGANMLKSNFVIGFCRTSTGIILVATTKGLYQYNTVSNIFKQVDKIPRDNFIYSVAEDHNGLIWIGTVRDGIYVYDPQNDTATKLAYDYPVKDALQSTTVNGIFEDSDSNIWFATEGLGLWKYNPLSKRFKYYSVNTGLPSNYVFKILEDEQKHIWVSTTRGLVSLNLRNDNIKIYTRANGLLSDQFNYNSAFKDDDGTMYFGCVKGLISFNPAEFKLNNFVAPVYITGFQVHNSEISVNGPDSLLKQSIISTSHIRLNHRQSSFSIDFAALSFAAPEMSQYKYIMQGLDRSWTYLKTNRKVYFTQLPPGHYKFVVKAANNNGVWSDRETVISIDIDPPFWASIWAYIIYALVCLAGTFYLLRAYHRRTRERNERFIKQLENDKEKELYNAKIEFFTNVAHEIRTPLTLIKGPMEKVMKKAELLPELHKNLKTMERNTDRLLDLTNQLLDFRKTETSGFSLSFVKCDVNSLLTGIFQRFNHMAEQRNVNYKLRQPTKILYAYVDAEAFTKIVSNLISNALKYCTSEVEIELLPYKDNDCSFHITVCNNGSLIPYEFCDKIFEPFFRMKESVNEVGTGIGLSLSRSLADLHNGKLFLNKPLNGFNIFTLTLPIHQEKEFDLHNNQDEYEHTLIPGRKGNLDFMKPTILIVDDNPEILDFISDELSEQYAIVTARNGKDALDVISVENIQLIISDVMMPVMDGFELCKLIKTNFDHSHIPIILLTAKNTLQSKIEGLEVGADAYIEKPFSPAHLQVQVANLLINRNKIKDYFASTPQALLKSMAYSAPDESFLDRLNSIIVNHLQDPELDVEQVANIMNMSKPTLYRKIKAISNLTINELINITRLKAAARLLEETDHKIYEVATMVGYSSQSHLGRNFLKQFGATPSEYQQAKRVVAKTKIVIG